MRAVFPLGSVGQSNINKSAVNVELAPAVAELRGLAGEPLAQRRRRGHGEGGGVHDGRAAYRPAGGFAD